MQVGLRTCLAVCTCAGEAFKPRNVGLAATWLAGPAAAGAEAGTAAAAAAGMAAAGAAVPSPS